MLRPNSLETTLPGRDGLLISGIEHQYDMDSYKGNIETKQNARGRQEELDTESRTIHVGPGDAGAWSIRYRADMKHRQEVY